MRWLDKELDLADLLPSEQVGPMSEQVAEWLEEICLASTPGPLVIDAKSDGGGVLVATLPDGRFLVSRDTEVRSAEDSQSAADANATLICQARSALLRLLHERRQWLQNEQVLRDKLQIMEVQWQRERSQSGEEDNSFPPR